ncbi:LysR family transcriptional regulator [Comamonas humi]
MITELRTFLAVARLGTFAGAGDAIGLTQSAVSSQMRRLEAHFGQSLFDRTGRSSALNAAGQALVPQAGQLLRQFDLLGQDDPAHSAPARLTIGAIATAQSSLLVPALLRLRGQHPQTQVQVVPGTSMELLDQLDTGALDAALIIRPPFGVDPQLLWQPLVQEPYALLAPARLPRQDWKELLQTQPFIRYDRRSFGGRMVDRFLRQAQLAPHEIIELDDLPSLLALVAQGAGVAIAPLAAALQPLPEAVRVLPLGEPPFHREVGLLRQRQAAPLPALQALAQALETLAKPGFSA